ncbi:MFS transporter [Arthrobacter deserti]|uniref:MFS transporter n=1 Tax=Arthrobacter deserti TaxID=1742687 RepID=A0ABX1JS58_9MICC|nr:MFS transporter [Arthrobacter deserti]
MGVGPLLYYGLSATSPLVIADLGISQGQFGLLATAVFASAAVSSIWLGKLSDRISSRAQLILIFAGTAAALVVAAFGRHYAVLLLAALIAGPAQAISNPTTTRIIIHHVAPPKRPGWVGIKQSGVQGSQLFVGLVFPAAALLAGWQGAMVLGAAVAVVLLGYGLRPLPAEKPVPARGSTAAGTGGPEAAGRFPASIWLFAGYALLAGLGTQATNVYLPLFAVRELDFPLVLGGVAAGVSGVVGVSSRILWGRRMATGVRAPTLLALMGAGALVGALALLAAGELGVPALLWAGVVLHGATVLGATVVTMAGVMRVVAGGRVGAVSGIVAMGMFAGFAAGPLAMGLLLDGTASFRTGWLLVGAGYLLCILLALVLRSYGNRSGVVR